MELKDFIKSTIIQISESINELNAELNEKCAVVNPAYSGCSGKTITRSGCEYSVADIDFDLSISVAENAEKGAKIGVLASAVGLGASMKTGNDNSSVSRLKFTLPVMLPFSDAYAVIDAKNRIKG